MNAKLDIIRALSCSAKAENEIRLLLKNKACELESVKIRIPTKYIDMIVYLAEIGITDLQTLKKHIK